MTSREKNQVRTKRWREENHEYDIARKKAYRKTKKDDPYYLYKMYERRSKKRKFAFTITLAQFEGFIKQKCNYCGLLNIRNGLDRVDSSKGYTIDNVVPCCPLCNTMKLDKTREQFLEQCQRILDYTKSA